MVKQRDIILGFSIVLALILSIVYLPLPNGKETGLIIGEETSPMVEEEVISEYLHFVTKNITYSMQGQRTTRKDERMRSAFKELEEKVGEFNFIEIDDYDGAQIKIEFPRPNNLATIAEASFIVEGENIIVEGEISIVKIDDDCYMEYPQPELHELLHVLGFDHKSNSIMNPSNDQCYHLIAESSTKYIEHLQFIYSSGLRGVEHPEIPMFKFNE